MTEKDKAIKLVDRYSELGIGHPTSLLLAKQCALIAVDEIINNIPCREDYTSNGWVLIDNTEYWEEVKQELELL